MWRGSREQLIKFLEYDNNYHIRVYVLRAFVKHNRKFMYVCLIWVYIFEISWVVFLLLFFCGTWMMLIVCYFPVEMESFGVGRFCTTMKIIGSPDRSKFDTSVHASRNSRNQLNYQQMI